MSLRQFYNALFRLLIFYLSGLLNYSITNGLECLNCQSEIKGLKYVSIFAHFNLYSKIVLIVFFLIGMVIGVVSLVKAIDVWSGSGIVNQEL